MVYAANRKFWKRCACRGNRNERNKPSECLSTLNALTLQELLAYLEIKEHTCFVAYVLKSMSERQTHPNCRFKKVVTMIRKGLSRCLNQVKRKRVK